jgi:hypothetical protein
MILGQIYQRVPTSVSNQNFFGNCRNILVKIPIDILAIASSLKAGKNQTTLITLTLSRIYARGRLGMN